MLLNNNYEVLVLAGYGAMGQAFLSLCYDFVARFQTLVLLDIDSCADLPGGCDRFIQQDVHDRELLTKNLQPYIGRFLFINLTAGTDTYQVRQVIAELDGAYIDTALIV
ncbi:hypothetical protein ACFL3F_03510 [Planctomycetota bacterium]